MYWLAVMIWVQIIACMINYVLWKYLASKPLGQQTVLDTTIQDYIIVITVNFVARTVSYVKFTESYSHELAMCIVTISQSTIMALLLQIMVTIGIRYMYIFHTGFMNETSDKNISFVTRCFVGFGVLLSVILNDYGKGGPEYSFLTNSVAKKPQGSPTFWLFRLVMALNILLLVLTQVRIEMFKKRTNPRELIRKTPRKSKNSIFGSKAVAITIVLLLIVFIVSLELILLPSNINNLAKVLRTRALTSLIMHVLLPSLWIGKNKKILDFFFRMMYKSSNLPSPTAPGLKLVFKKTNKVKPMA